MGKTKVELTEENVSEAIKILTGWFPDEAESFKKHHDAIVSHILASTEPKANDPLLLQANAKPKVALASANVSLSPCAQAICVFVFDVVMFVLGLAGLHVANEERIQQALLRELGEDMLRGFQGAIQAFNEAQGATARATALLDIFRQIYDTGVFSTAFEAIRKEMTWWDWVKTSVIAVAQIATWVLTDGAAFIAEVALNIMSAEQMLEDGVKAVQVCSK